MSGGSLTVEPPPPLEVQAIAPTPGRVEVGPGTVFRVEFSEPLDPDSLGADPLALTDVTSQAPVAGRVIVSADGKALEFRPAGAIEPERRYCLAISPAIRSLEGGALRLPREPAFGDCQGLYDAYRAPPVLSGALLLSAVSSSALRATWEPASDESTPPERIAYNLYFATAAGALDFDAPVRTTGQGVTTDLLTGLEPDTEYRAAVRAVDEAGNLSPPSTEGLARTLGDRDLEPPVFPGGIERLEATSPFTLRASWSPATDNQDEQGLLRYNLYLALESGGQDFEIIAKTSLPGATSVDIDGLPPDTAHFAVVRAVDTAGNEDANIHEAAATTPLSFRTNVFPILTRRDQGGCSQPGCHQGTSPDGGLNLESYQGLIRGGLHRSPPAVVPGDGQGSYLLWRTDRNNPNFQRSLSLMPLGRRPLSDLQLRTIERWIDQGAQDN